MILSPVAPLFFSISPFPYLSARSTFQSRCDKGTKIHIVTNTYHDFVIQGAVGPVEGHGGLIRFGSWLGNPIV